MQSHKTVETFDQTFNLLKDIYFNPLLIAFKEANIDIKSALLQIEYELKIAWSSAYDENSTSSLLWKITRVKITPDMVCDKLTNKFDLSHFPEVVTKLQSLVAVCLLDDMQKVNFEITDKLTILSCMRELIYNAINPTPLSIPNSINTKTVSIDNLQKLDCGIFILPRDIQYLILDLLSAEETISFKLTCKNAYVLQKKWQDTNNHLLYVVGNQVRFTNPRLGMMHMDQYVVLRQDIPGIELFESISKSKSASLKAFKSFFQANEYALSRQHGGFLTQEGYGKEYGYIPAIWSVIYSGSMKNLDFKRSVILIDNPDIKNRASIESVTISNKSFVPLTGVVAYTPSFAEHNILGEASVIAPSNNDVGRISNMGIFADSKAISTREKINLHIKSLKNSIKSFTSKSKEKIKILEMALDYMDDKITKDSLLRYMRNHSLWDNAILFSTTKQLVNLAMSQHDAESNENGDECEYIRWF